MKRLFLIAVIVAMICPALRADVLGEFHFEGRLDNRIPISLTFCVNGSYVVVGEITYTHVNSTPILLVGDTDVNLESFSLREFLPDGTVTGMLSFKIDLETGEDYPVLYDGIWTNPRTGQTFKINVEDAACHADFSQFYDYASESDIKGEYAYKIWDKNLNRMVTNTATFSESVNHAVAFSFRCHEFGDVSLATKPDAPVQLIPMTYDSFYKKDFDETGLGVEAQFYKKFVVVRTARNGEDVKCFAGSVDGVYFKKTK
ncbi:MAG: hypothetical protein J6X81_02490 [Muribaculaceae bacterium]|nr:hypothetical protein [Muribaculaceae bacterium]